MKNKIQFITIICFLLQFSSVWAQNKFQLDDLENHFSKKEKIAFERAVEYEMTFYNRIFHEQDINFSEIKFTVVPNFLQFMLYQSQSGSIHQNSSGFYAPSRQELVVCKDEKFKDSFLKTCFHKISHAFLHLHAGKESIPAWLNEGLAVYLENMTYSAKKITHQTNKYSLVRVKTLIELKDLNLSEFVNWDYGKFATTSFSQEGYGYATGYCMVLFLMQKDEEKAIAIFNGLLDSKTSTEIFDKYYNGGFAQFEKDFVAEYCHK
jgi:hypothetical protein